MRVCLGGTFSPFHAGHRRLIQAALDAGSEVFVGVTTDAFAGARKTRKLLAFDERTKAVEAFVRGTGWKGRLVVQGISHEFGASTEPGYDCIVVSDETATVAARVNEARAAKRLPRLSVIVVPFLLGEDLLPVKATRIAEGDIDAEGRRLRPLRVAVGSTNPAKLGGTEDAFRRLLPGVTLAIEGFPAPSGVPDQPWGAQAAEGARRRAQAVASRSVAGKPAEYAVGIEAGLLEVPGMPRPLDVQFCCIRDASGWETEGSGPGFEHPPAVLDDVRKGSTVGRAVGALARSDDLGRKEGAIGWLTKGRFSRRALTAEAVVAALVPRIRRDLYRSARAPS